MSLSLRHIIYSFELPGMVYLRKEDDLFCAEDVDLYNLHIYKNYVILPHIKESTVYDAFLDSRNMVQEKKYLHELDDFEVSFRKFLDYSKRHGYMLDKYGYFKEEYLKPIAIEWCNKNRIQYVDDL